MVTRACISINNRCNLNCTYCHFHEKKDYIQEDNMDVITILDIIACHVIHGTAILFTKLLQSRTKESYLIIICHK